MEWNDFRRLVMTDPSLAHIRGRVLSVQVHWSTPPEYVMWNKGWSSRRNSKRHVHHDSSQLAEFLTQLCGDQWVGVTYTMTAFKRKSDAMLAKLSWPEHLL